MNPEYRSRLVVREIKKRKKPEDRLDPADVFSTMPPVEGLKMMLSEWVTTDAGTVTERLALWDVSRAHFYGESKRELFTNLPEEMHVDGMCAKLLKAMYGTEDAANIWADTWPQHLAKHGIPRGEKWKVTWREVKVHFARGGIPLGGR